MSKVMRFVGDFEGYKSGQTVAVDDQVALNAFAQGCAVPTTDAPDAPVVEQIAAPAPAEAALVESVDAKPAEVAPTVEAAAAPAPAVVQDAR